MRQNCSLIRSSSSIIIKKQSYTYTLLCSSLQIDLVRADTKTANGHQVLSSIKYLLGKLSLGTDTNDMDITDLFNQFITDKGLSIGLDLYKDKQRLEIMTQTR